LRRHRPALLLQLLCNIVAFDTPAYKPTLCGDCSPSDNRRRKWILLETAWATAVFGLASDRKARGLRVGGWMDGGKRKLIEEPTGPAGSHELGCSVLRRPCWMVFLLIHHTQRDQWHHFLCPPRCVKLAVKCCRLALPCDAINSPAYAMARCLSVCPVGCLSRPCIVWKELNVFSNFFSLSGSSTILVSSHEILRRYSDGVPIVTASMFDHYLVLSRKRYKIFEQSFSWLFFFFCTVRHDVYAACVFLWLLRVLAVLRLNATLIFSFIIIINVKKLP